MKWLLVILRCYYYSVDSNYITLPPNLKETALGTTPLDPIALMNIRLLDHCLEC